MRDRNAGKVTLFHVCMGGAEHRAFRFFDDKALNLLVAASMLESETRCMVAGRGSML